MSEAKLSKQETGNLRKNIIMIIVIVMIIWTTSTPAVPVTAFINNLAVVQQGRAAWRGAAPTRRHARRIETRDSLNGSPLVRTAARHLVTDGSDPLLWFWLCHLNYRKFAQEMIDKMGVLLRISPTHSRGWVGRRVPSVLR